MKIKKITAKLTVNKETVANLENKDMRYVYGGIQVTDSNPTNCQCGKTILTKCCK